MLMLKSFCICTTKQMFSSWRAVSPADMYLAVFAQNELFIATSEPHGQIECTVSRKEAFKPMPRL